MLRFVLTEQNLRKMFNSHVLSVSEKNSFDESCTHDHRSCGLVVRYTETFSKLGHVLGSYMYICDTCPGFCGERPEGREF